MASKRPRVEDPLKVTNTKQPRASPSVGSSSAAFQTPLSSRFFDSAGFKCAERGIRFQSQQLHTLTHSGRTSLHQPRPRINSSSSSPSVIVEETEGELRAREDADAMNETVLAIDMKDRKTLGCAYYIAGQEKLYIINDIKTAGIELIDTLKVHASPTLILLNARADEMLVNHLGKEARDQDNSICPSNFKDYRILI